jgi:hypothetical protein
MNTKLKFAFEKETKGAVRYQEVGEDGAPAFAPQVGTLSILSLNAEKKPTIGRPGPYTRQGLCVPRPCTA